MTKYRKIALSGAIRGRRSRAYDLARRLGRYGHRTSKRRAPRI